MTRTNRDVQSCFHVRVPHRCAQPHVEELWHKQWLFSRIVALLKQMLEELVCGRGDVQHVVLLVWQESENQDHCCGNKGMATMKQGEVARFTPSPESTYGKNGLPEVPCQRLSFLRCALVNWVSQDVLFNDGGVIKAVLREGSGWKKSKPGHEVKISMEVPSAK